MIFYLITVVYVLYPLLQLCESQKREALQRFIVEEGVKLPIFGAYRYDPIKQSFDLSPTDAPGNAQSTVATMDGMTGNIVNVTVGLRKRVSGWGARPVSTTRANSTSRSTHWWARAKLPTKNDTTIIKDNAI